MPESQISTSNSPDAALIVLYKQLKEKSVQTLRGAAEISAETELFFVLRTIFAYDRIGCPLLALYLVKSWTFPPEEVSLSKRPNHILRSRRRTTILDIPLPNDDPISSGVVNIDTWSWDPPITPTSPEANISKSTTDKAGDILSDEPQHLQHQRVGSFSRKTSFDFNRNSSNNDDDNDDNIWSWNSPKSFQNYGSFGSRNIDYFSNDHNSDSKNKNNNNNNPSSENNTLLNDNDFSDYKIALVKRLAQV